MMVIWAALIIASFLCAPLLRWQGFVITTVLVVALYWVIVGAPEPTVLSYAINFVLIVLAMQIGYVLGLVATAKITQMWHDKPDAGWLGARQGSKIGREKAKPYKEASKDAPAD